MTEDLSKAQKILLKKIEKSDDRIEAGDLYGEYESVTEAYGSQKSLSNGLRKLADNEFLERERDGRGYKYWLSSKGKKTIQNIKKRERDRKEKERDLFEYEDGLEQFLDYFEDPDWGEEQIREVGIGRNYVVLDYKKLEKFHHELADDLLNDPDRVLDACKEAVNSLPEVNRQVNIRVKNVSEIETQSVSDLTARDRNKLVTIEGVIQSVSKPGSVMVSITAECSQCGDTYEQEQSRDGSVSTPYKCDCGSRNFDILQENHETVRFVRIKEKPNKKSRNKIVATLQGDVAEDESKNLEAIGSGVKVTGYLETHKKNKNDSKFDFRLNANNIEIEETKWEIEDISQEELERINEISNRDDVFDYVSKSLGYEQIKNADLIKKTFILWLLGRSRNFGNLHVLCVGDPGTAKSHLARIVEEDFGKVIKAVATGATEVGLTASVVKDEVTGEYTAEGGSLPMADGGFHITDEIDELKKDHYSAFNEALSDQSISLAKANIQTEISADVAEFSIGNPKGYSFDPYKEKYEQIPIDKDDLISRYGLILGLESNSNGSDQSIRDEREKINHVLNRNDARSFEDHDFIESDMLGKYIYYAQRIYPQLTEDSKQMIEDSYMRLFEAQPEDENFVKPRHGNALAVLSVAFARLNLSDEVKEKHVSSAFDFFKRCYQSIDFEIGKDNISDIEGQNSRKWKKVEEAMTNIRGNVQIDDLIDQVDLSEEEVLDVLEKMKSKGAAFEPEQGCVKAI